MFCKTFRKNEVRYTNLAKSFFENETTALKWICADAEEVILSSSFKYFSSSLRHVLDFNPSWMDTAILIPDYSKNTVKYLHDLLHRGFTSPSSEKDSNIFLQESVEVISLATQLGISVINVGIKQFNKESESNQSGGESGIQTSVGDENGVSHNVQMDKISSDSQAPMQPPLNYKMDQDSVIDVSEAEAANPTKESPASKNHSLRIATFAKWPANVPNSISSNVKEIHKTKQHGVWGASGSAR